MNYAIAFVAGIFFVPACRMLVRLVESLREDKIDVLSTSWKQKMIEEGRK